jgi:hypothetical protein
MKRRISDAGRASFLSLLVCILAAFVFTTTSAWAATVTSTGSGNWYAGVWNPSVPTSGDDVFIASGHTITITGIYEIAINSLSVTGTLNHSASGSTEAHKIILDIANDCTIAGSGSINVQGRGHSGGNGPGEPTGSHAGGSHGGEGGRWRSTETVGATYGSAIAPTNVGSGSNSSGEGGGAVILTVDGTTTVDGTIDADGELGTSGGAGGSVFITTANFGGTGTISVDGNYPNRSDTGGGGGGRIAVVLTSGSSFGSVTMTAYPGNAGTYGKASAGTIYTKTAAQTYGTLSVNNNGIGTYSGDYINGVTRIPASESWQVDKVVVTNGGNLWVASGATLTATGFEDSDVSGYVTVEGTLDLPDDATVTNVTFQPHSGCTLALTNLTVASGAVVSHHPNKTTEDYTLEIDIPGDLTVQSGGSIDVTRMGYRYRRTPTGDPYNGTDYGMGGSHGGQGGKDRPGEVDSYAKDTYDSVIAPTNIGSGGWASGVRQNEGGGAIKLTVGGTLDVDGTIAADGGEENTTLTGGGAGGSVWVTATNLTGSGAIRANGGDAPNSSNGTCSGGGGGRIAVILTGSDTFGSVDIEAYGGDGTNQDGAAGTIYRQKSSQTSTSGELTVDNGSRANQRLIYTGYSPDRVYDSMTDLNGMDAASYTFSMITVTNGGDLSIGSDDSVTLASGGTFVGDPSADDDGIRINGGTLNVDASFSYTDGFIAIDSSGSQFSPGTALTIGTDADLVVNAAHTITGNVTVAAGGAITHNEQRQDEMFKVDLTIDGDLTIPAGGAVDVDGVGYYNNYGPGGGEAYGFGGTHGGQGGYRSSGSGTEDDCYGSVTSPTNIGSGGFEYQNNGRSDGGGAAKITVTGTTDLDGLMTADGRGGNTLRLDAGGAGGSIWLTTSNLTGSGTIRANGGTGSTYNDEDGAGGGGRVAVHLTGSDSFGSVTMQAFGETAGTSSTARKGAAGTVYKQTQGAGKGTLIIDNNGTTASSSGTQISASVTDASVGDVHIQNSAHLEINDNQSITVCGSWSNAASFSAGTDATVELAGAATATVYGDNMFDSLVITGVTKQVNFEIGTTQDVDNVFSLEGLLSNTGLVLRSTSPGTQWFLNLDAATVVGVSYVDVQDSNADPGTAVAAGNSLDSGNNNNWVFGVAGQTNIWIGPTSTDWGEVLNWTLGRAPIADDAAIVISNGTFDPVMPSGQTFNNLDVQAGAVLSLNNFDLTVNADSTVAGTITAAGSETITVSNLTVSGTLTLAGTETVLVAGLVDFSGGTFTAASSHVVINGSIAQTVTSSGNSFNTLTMSNQSALVTFADASVATLYYSQSGNVTYGGNFSATQFHVYSDSGAITQTFNSGSTYTFQEFWLHGTAGKVQHLESSSSSAWNLNVSGFANVNYVDAEYSDASGGAEILALNSTDSGNNVNWNFGGPFSTWVGSISTDFDTAGNWSPSGVPDATTYIIVDDTTTLNIDAPATVKYARIGGVNASLVEVDSDFTVVANVDVINNGTLEINNDPGMTVGTNMTVGSGGVLTHADNTSTEADKMMLTVGGNLIIASGAEIDVEGKGYEVGYGPGNPSDSYIGGSHGGIGGTYSSYTGVGPTYGSYTSPINLGSGGDTYGDSEGGGAVRLIVGGTCTVDGTIDADGKTAAATTSGSGGSVYITCGSFAGSGTISADGGYSTRADMGGGGGGRVAVILTSGTTFGSVTLQALPNWTGNWKPGAGTVYTKTATQTYGTLKVDNDNLSSLANEAGGKGTPIPNGETWEVEELVLLNNAHLRVTNSTTLNFRGARSFAGSETDAYLIIEDGGTLDVSGDLTVSNVTVMPHWDATLAGLTNLTMADGGVLSHLPNVGASEAYRLKLDIPGNLTVRSGGAVDVTARGYDKTYGPGTPTSTYNGGSYGGQGGNYSGQTGYGKMYGSVLAPTNSGSGPGSNGHSTSDGGGVTRLIVGGATTVDGEILADGGGAPGSSYSGGAGGSIYLTTATISGSGLIRAAGGTPNSRTDTGSGGGGRIGVVLTSGNTFGSIEISARGGTSGHGNGGSAPGTVYLEKASEGAGSGRVLIDCKGEDYGKKTYLPAETLAISDELVGALIIVTNANTTLTLFDDITVGDLAVYTGSDLVLGVYTMYVNSAEHHIDDPSEPGAGGPTNTVVDFYDQIIWVGVDSYDGTVIMFL